MLFLPYLLSKLSYWVCAFSSGCSRAFWGRGYSSLFLPLYCTKSVVFCSFTSFEVFPLIILLQLELGLEIRYVRSVGTLARCALRGEGSLYFLAPLNPSYLHWWSGKKHMIVIYHENQTKKYREAIIFFLIHYLHLNHYCKNVTLYSMIFNDCSHY